VFPRNDLNVVVEREDIFTAPAGNWGLITSHFFVPLKLILGDNST
jgi:hypothetical protein